MVGFFRAIHALAPLRAPGVPKKVEPQKNCDSDYSYGNGIICPNCAVCTKDQRKSNEIKMISNINSFYASICINSTQLRAKPSPIQCARRCPAKRQRISKTLMKYDQIDFKQIKHLVYSLDIYPPTPAVSRGSASEEALLATRCQKGRRVCAERKPAPGGHEQGGSWQCRNAGKVKVWS